MVTKSPIYLVDVQIPATNIENQTKFRVHVIRTCPFWKGLLYALICRNHVVSTRHRAALVEAMDVCGDGWDGMLNQHAREYIYIYNYMYIIFIEF